MTTNVDKAAELQRIGRDAMDAIREMVDALAVDWSRLTELREEREGLLDEHEADEDDDEARIAWESWQADYTEELAELERLAGDCDDEDDAVQRITEDPLSLEYRSGWVSPGEEMEPEEFRLLLTTGGPAVRIVGDLLDRGGCGDIRLQVQDWFTPWTDVETTSEDDEALELYVSTIGVGEF